MSRTSLPHRQNRRPLTEPAAAHPGGPRRPPQFAQELLSTFSTSLGEVALQPSTGGTFVVELFFSPPAPAPHTARDPSNTTTETETEPAPPPRIQHRVLWDRAVDGGFPETKELKRRVRDAVEPGRNLGHVDRDHARPSREAVAAASATPARKEQSQPVVAAAEKTRQGGSGAGDGGKGSSNGDGDGGSKQACEDCQ